MRFQTAINTSKKYLCFAPIFNSEPKLPCSHCVNKNVLCMKENIIILTLFHAWIAYNIIPGGVVICHRKYASNICDHSTSCFYSSVWKKDQPFKNINVNVTRKLLLVSTSANIIYEPHIQPLVRLAQLAASAYIFIITTTLKFVPEELDRLVIFTHMVLWQATNRQMW